MHRLSFRKGGDGSFSKAGDTKIMSLQNYNPIQVESYEILDEHLHPVTDSTPVEKRMYVRVISSNGGIYIAKRVPLEHALARGWPLTKPQLYSTCAGNFFSLSSKGLASAKPGYGLRGETCRKTGGFWKYAHMPNFGNIPCHKAVYWAWKGAVPAGRQIDHIDGNPLNNHIDNLEAVTPAENIRRAKRLRRLRKLGFTGWCDIIFGHTLRKLFSLSDDGFNQYLRTIPTGYK